MWLCLLLTVPGLHDGLHMLAGFCLIVVLFIPLARRFIWRTRFLFFALLLILPWTTPGIYAIESAGVLSPTREGLLMAALQMERSLVVLSSLALALGGLDVNGRLCALLGLLHPLSRLGFPVERVAVRLALTLQWLDLTPPRRRWQDWQNAWTETVHADVAASVLEIDLGRWRARDYLLAVMGTVGVIVCVGL